MGSRKTHAVGDGRLRGDAVVLNGDGLEADIGRVAMREASVPFLVRSLASAGPRLALPPLTSALTATIYA